MDYSQTNQSSPHHFLTSLQGSWAGKTRTWYEPGVPAADESAIQGSMQLILEGRFAIFIYQTSMDGAAQHGMFTFGYNTTLNQYEASWVDSFHTGSSIMFCTGQPATNGFFVLGSYPDPTGGPDWGWRTELQATDHDHMLMKAYNVSPEGAEVLAVETTLERIK